MDQAIPLRKISLQNETGLSEDVLNEQAPDAFMIAWRLRCGLVGWFSSLILGVEP